MKHCVTTEEHCRSYWGMTNIQNTTTTFPVIDGSAFKLLESVMFLHKNLVSGLVNSSFSIHCSRCKSLWSSFPCTVHRNESINKVTNDFAGM